MDPETTDPAPPEAPRHLVRRMRDFTTTIFAEMTALAAAHDAVNLGQGFPDFDPPGAVTLAAIQAIRDGHNQYAPGIGVPGLRAAIREHDERFWGRDYDPDDEITVSAGATEAITAAMLALCEAGDEVVVFQPAYDSYLASIAMAGAVPRVVTLQPPAFSYDPDAVERLIGPRTRLLLLNSPHNPTGKVFTSHELEHLARLCVRHDLVAVTDEVYEHLAFDRPHVPLASLPGMRDRTVTISSAGKTFSVTGWKVGWFSAAAELTRAVRTTKQFLTFTNATPFQHAVIEALLLDDDYFAGLASSYRARRDRLVGGLSALGFEVFPPEGTYFATVDTRSVGYDDGLEFCRMLPERVGVAAIPESVFYLDPSQGRSLVRFAFCKSDALIDEGLERLKELR